MNDYDDAALGDYTASAEDVADAGVCTCPDESEWDSPVEPPANPTCPIHGDPEPTASQLADAEVHGAQGGGRNEGYPPDPPAGWSPPAPADDMPPLATWPGHEDCDPRGRIHDEVEGWVCSCGAILGELPDAGQVQQAVETYGQQPGAEVQGRDPIVTVIMPLDLEQVTPAEIERQLASIMARLEMGAHYQRQVEVQAFTLRSDLDVAMAKTVKRLVEEGAKGDAGYRKACAIADNEELYRQTLEAEETRRCVRETMHNLRSMQTGFQTIARSVGASFGNPMQGQGGYAPRGY